MQEYDCSRHYTSRGQSHVYEVDVQSRGRLVLDQCDNRSPVAMQLFHRTAAVASASDHARNDTSHDPSATRTSTAASTRVTTPPSTTPSGSVTDWELVRGFDDALCNARNFPTQVTWWLEPGQHALVVDYTTTGTGCAAAVNLVNHGDNPGIVLNACEGDCDDDSDCAEGLYGNFDIILNPILRIFDL